MDVDHFGAVELLVLLKRVQWDLLQNIDEDQEHRQGHDHFFAVMRSPAVREWPEVGNDFDVLPRCYGVLEDDDVFDRASDMLAVHSCCDLVALSVSENYSVCWILQEALNHDIGEVELAMVQTGEICYAGIILWCPFLLI